MVALAGVGVLLVVAGVRVWQIAGSMGPPPPPALVRTQGLVEWASMRHLRPGPTRLPADLPPALAGYRQAFPALGFAPAWPADWPEQRREVLAAAFLAERGALQVRFRDGDGHGSLFLMPTPTDGPVEAATFDRGRLRVRLRPGGPGLEVVVEATP